MKRWRDGKSDRRKLQQTCSNHLGGRVQGSAAPGLLTIMSCRMITTVIKCQQPSILPLSLFFSYLDVWGATTSRWEGGRLQVQTVSGTGPDPIFFLSLQAMENPRSLRVHEVTTSQIPAAWQWTTMPDMLGKMPQCHATFQIFQISRGLSFLFFWGFSGSSEIRALLCCTGCCTIFTVKDIFWMAKQILKHTCL